MSADAPRRVTRLQQQRLTQGGTTPPPNQPPQTTQRALLDRAIRASASRSPSIEDVEMAEQATDQVHFSTMDHHHRLAISMS